MSDTINSVTLSVERYENLRIIERAHLSNAVMKVTIERGSTMLAILEPTAEIKIMNDTINGLRDELKSAKQYNRDRKTDIDTIKCDYDGLNGILETLSKSTVRQFRRWRRKENK